MNTLFNFFTVLAVIYAIAWLLSITVIIYREVQTGIKTELRDSALIRFIICLAWIITRIFFS